MGYDKTYNRNPFVLMEDLVFTDVVSAANIAKIEHYLALNGRLPTMFSKL